MSDYKSDTAPNFETYVLKKIKVAMSKRFGKTALHYLKVQVDDYAGDLADEVTLRFETELFGQQMLQTYPIELLVPKNWWQHLKDDHFPEGWKRRWPVQYKSVFSDVTFDHRALLPKFDRIPPGEEIVMFTAPYWEDPKIPN
jgi:hypothetical protein